MKGLILKDIIIAIKQNRLLVFLVAAIAMNIIIGSDLSSIVGIIGVVPFFLLLSSFGYDDLSQINPFFLTTPISRTMFVISKYLYMLLLVIIFLILTLIMGVSIGMDAIQIANIYAIVSIGGITLCSLLIPIIYAIGLEKSRIIILALVFIPAFFGAQSSNSNGESSDIMEILPVIFENLPIIALIAMSISIPVSVAVLKKKEF